MLYFPSLSLFPSLFLLYHYLSVVCLRVRPSCQHRISHMRLNTIPWYLSSPSLSLFFFLFLLSLCLSVCLSVCLSQSAPPQATEPYNKMKQVMLNTLLWYPSFLSLSLSPPSCSLCLSAGLPVSLSVCASQCLSVTLSLLLSVCVSVCLSVSSHHDEHVRHVM